MGNEVLYRKKGYITDQSNWGQLMSVKISNDNITNTVFLLSLSELSTKIKCEDQGPVVQNCQAYSLLL